MRAGRTAANAPVESRESEPADVAGGTMPVDVVLAVPEESRARLLGCISREQRTVRVVWVCPTADDLRDSMRDLSSAVLLLDVALLSEGQPLLLLEILRASTAPRVVLLVGDVDDGQLFEWMRQGVLGLLRRDATQNAVRDCVSRVRDGGHWMRQDLALRALQTFVRRESALAEVASVLTTREFEVMRLVAMGFRNREVAGELCVAEGTVKGHLHSIYSKLGLGDRAALGIFARQHMLF